MSREEVDSLTALPGPPGDDELGADTWAWLLAWASLVSATCPSNSSPWLPAISRTRGPGPLRRQTMGIGIQP